MADNRSGTLSGLTAQEAKEFHSVFMTGFFLFTVIALVAHWLVWTWRPWFPGENGYVSLIDGVNYAATYLTTLTG